MMETPNEWKEYNIIKRTILEEGINDENEEQILRLVVESGEEIPIKIKQLNNARTVFLNKLGLKLNETDMELLETDPMKFSEILPTINDEYFFSTMFFIQNCYNLVVTLKYLTLLQKKLLYFYKRKIKGIENELVHNNKASFDNVLSDTIQKNSLRSVSNIEKILHDNKLFSKLLFDDEWKNAPSKVISNEVNDEEINEENYYDEVNDDDELDYENEIDEEQENKVSVLNEINKNKKPRGRPRKNKKR